MEYQELQELRVRYRLSRERLQMIISDQDSEIEELRRDLQNSIISNEELREKIELLNTKLETDKKQLTFGDLQLINKKVTLYKEELERRTKTNKSQQKTTFRGITRSLLQPTAVRNNLQEQTRQQMWEEQRSSSDFSHEQVPRNSIDWRRGQTALLPTLPSYPASHATIFQSQQSGSSYNLQSRTISSVTDSSQQSIPHFRHDDAQIEEQQSLESGSEQGVDPAINL